ncbi:MAG: glycosyltransferase [Candidatus Marinimicrobia bacterium]|nr:glycosyltransferase [Candidatus Neomarinimicrobiota bacterium]MCF7921934.1 glycosyltransferase [Candidatus Neomarinimicrobiota bacterium]
MSQCDLSIVLPVYNDQENLDRILVELSSNKPDKSWEVIVVDDGSPTPLQLTLDCPPHWKMFRNENRQGAASARNKGVVQASGKHVALLSVFLKIPENYISQVTEFIKNHHFDVAQHLLKKAADLKADHFQEFLANQSGRLPEKGGTLPVKNTMFTAAILKKEVFSKLGGFDENMNHYGGHELDFAYRLDQQGYTTRFIVDNLPLERVKLESHNRIQARLQEYGKVGLPALLKKHPELKKTILLYPLVWSLLKTVDLPKSMERRFKRRIEQNFKLTRRQYRLYLHLIMRNAWDAR